MYFELYFTRYSWEGKKKQVNRTVLVKIPPTSYSTEHSCFLFKDGSWIIFLEQSWKLLCRILIIHDPIDPLIPWSLDPWIPWSIDPLIPWSLDLLIPWSQYFLLIWGPMLNLFIFQIWGYDCHEFLWMRSCEEYWYGEYGGYGEYGEYAEYGN